MAKIKRDFFHKYLKHCQDHPTSPGDFIETQVKSDRYGSRTAAYVRLVTDLTDTLNAGLLQKVPLGNGGVYYKAKEGTQNGNV